MGFKTLLCVSAAGGFFVLANNSQDAQAQRLTSANILLAAAEDKKPMASSQPRHVARRHYRHRGGRHPFYGSRH